MTRGATGWYMGSAERSVMLVAAVVAAVAAIFWQTSSSMVAVWSSSGTYSHGFLIVPAFLWLVWGRRHDLARLPIEPSWRALPLLAVTGSLWLVAQWMSWALPAQSAIVAMTPLALAAVLGGAWARALAFPLVFLFFAVPFGESFIPVLMNWTADFAVAALRLSGVPVYRDGLHFEIPGGKWSVVESCSGVRYLFACLAVSSLYSWTIYLGMMRRLLFIAVALAIAIVANWVRAYAIVMLAHLSDNQIAAGADHLVYGGIFFGFIMALVFLVGAWWREDAPAASAGAELPPPPDRSAVRVSSAEAWRRTGAALAAVATMLVWSSISIGSAQSALPAPIAALEIEAQQGWARVDDPQSSWRPVLNNPVAVVSQTFAKGTQRVGIHLGFFHRPTSDSKLTSATNRLLKPDGLDPNWKLASQGAARMHWNGEDIDVRTGVLVGTHSRLLAWQWYWVDGTATANSAHAALLQLLARLRGHNEMSAWLTVYTVAREDSAGAEQVLRQFLTEMAPSLVATMSQPTLLEAQAAR